MISKILMTEATALINSAQELANCATFSEQTFRAWLHKSEQIIFVGVGKSGHIARKAAASFASIGIRSFFIQAAELMHGDLGNISKTTLVVIISFSGKGAEILSAHAQIARRSQMLLSIAAPNSALANGCAMNLPLICSEAIVNMPAPTTSTTLSLAISDGLLAIAADEFKIGAPEFARHHPGGSLGKRYYEKVKDCMQKANCIQSDASLAQAISAMSSHGYVLLMQDDKLAGFLSDGDLRRALSEADFSLTSKASKYASKEPICIDANALAYDAKQLCANKKISALVVLDNNAVVGVMKVI